MHETATVDLMMSSPAMTNTAAIDLARVVCAATSAGRLVERSGGAVVEITTPAADAVIALKGAQVLRWQPAHAGRDVLWCPTDASLGAGKAIRGGVPICWPWFGPDPNDRSQHGFARNHVWRLTQLDTVADDVVATLTTDGALDAAYGAVVTATLSIRLGATLSLVLTTFNGSARDIPLSAAFHSYFAVSDVRMVGIDGLSGAIAVDLDRAGALHRQSGSLHFDAGRTLRFDTAPAVATLVDRGFARRIHVHRTTGRSTIVWHPGDGVAALADVPPDMAYGFVCIESGDVGASGVVLPSGHRHEIGVTYSIASIT